MVVPYIGHGSASPDSFFTHMHRQAAQMIGHQMVAGIYSRDAEKSATYGADFDSIGVETLEQALAAASGAKYGLVSLPNVGHYPAAKAMLEAGLPVLCEKPFTITLAQALELQALAAERRIPFAIAYTYQNFWSFSMAAKLCARRADGSPGLLGEVTSFNGDYFQEWQLEDLGIAQEWRQDPAVSGDFNCAGDILTHVEQVVRFITGETVASLLGSTGIKGPSLIKADASERAKGRQLDDDAVAMATLSNGAVGVLHASQVAAGRLNGCHFRIMFEYGMVEAHVEDPENLYLTIYGAPTMRLSRGQIFLSSGALQGLVKRDEQAYEMPLFKSLDPLTDASASIVLAPLPPGGHVAGFLTALSTMHHRFMRVVDEWEESGKTTVPEDFHGLATIDDGVKGMQFLATLKRSIDAGTPFTELVTAS